MQGPGGQADQGGVHQEVLLKDAGGGGGLITKGQRIFCQIKVFVSLLILRLKILQQKGVHVTQFLAGGRGDAFGHLNGFITHKLT